MKQSNFLFALLFAVLSAHAGDIVLPAVASSIKFTNPVVASNMSFGIETNTTGEGYTEITTIDGVPCRKIPAGKFMYVNCNRTAVPSTAKKIILSITYYDNSMSYLWLNYTRTGTGWGGADFKKSNTKKWITRLVIINDAGFDGSMGYGGDIRMGFGSEDNYIKDITVYIGALTPDAQPVPAKPNNPTEFKGKSYAGYQLWHEAGPQPKDWSHWAYGMLPAAGRGNHNTETFPYLADYQNNANVTMYPTNFANLGNGSPAKLYNSTDKSVIDVQMSLLQKAGFDGVAIQRNAPVGKDLKYTSSDDYYVNIKNACEANGRSFYVMYCMPDINNGAGLSDDLVDGIKRDWVYQMEQIYALTSSSAYATVNGKPVVELWGLGYSTITVDKAQALALAQFFKDRGCYVIAGVPRDWRLMDGGSRKDFADVYKAYNMISPWTVGVYSDTTGANSFRTDYMIPDKQYCDQNGMDFYPVIFPGSAWSQHVYGYPNDTKRLGGQFLWKQARNIKSLGIQSMYFAMLDEFEESTNIISAATDYFDIPTDQYFGTLSMDGIWTSSDYYLRLAGAASRMLTSTTTPAEIPIPYSNGPIYYRNSFESRVAKCLIDNVAKDIISPIDACFYKNTLLSGTSVSNTTVAIVNEPTFTKNGIYSVKINGTATGASNYYYKISETKIAVKANQQLSFWKYTVSNPGKYTSVDLSFKSGKVLRNLTAYKDNKGNIMHPSTARGTVGAWEKFSCQIGKGELIGDEINGIIIAYDNPSLNGNFTAYFDDIIIEDAKDTTTTTTKAPIGSTISLMNGGFYVSSENGTTAMNCNRTSVGVWENFEVVDAGNGAIALKGNNGLYVTSASPMYCTGTAINNDTKFTWIELNNNLVALQGTAGTYACSENGAAAMNCNRTAIGGWETFNWTALSSARMAYVVKEPIILQAGLKVYPNPASSYVIVSYELKTPSPVVIQIANMHGDVVKSARVNSQSGQQRLNVTLTDLTSGIYMVKIMAGGTTETKKLVVY
ncbi:Por secretion system C-terminal sorting domain-containing protein [Chitinophaga sp. CF118]|uniref:T9SS type A sorting domain-containing protein n=1 Tax=Chitinophaga sp. CF118 TaxID=1884367 RepID=UPI0008E9BFA9|nr:T9SS type A sorting domain-containing protein [Chitinophaga sp. CF118]SFE34875.1 Por secretion system C-terminal sorting domain-containing protein [Chitinophaga sp. CF118]